jgi:hypothetical protein
MNKKNEDYFAQFVADYDKAIARFRPRFQKRLNELISDGWGFGNLRQADMIEIVSQNEHASLKRSFLSRLLAGSCDPSMKVLLVLHTFFNMEKPLSFGQLLGVELLSQNASKLKKLTKQSEVSESERRINDLKRTIAHLDTLLIEAESSPDERARVLALRKKETE